MARDVLSEPVLSALGTALGVGPDGIISNEVVFQPGPSTSDADVLEAVGTSVVRVMGIRLEAGVDGPEWNVFSARRLSGGAAPIIEGGKWGGFIIMCKRWVKHYDTDITMWACAAVTDENQAYDSKEDAEAAIAQAVQNKLLYPYWMSSGGLDWSVPVGHVVVKARDRVGEDEYNWTDADGFDPEAEAENPPDVVEFSVYDPDGIEDGGISLPLPTVVSDIHKRIEVLTNEKLATDALDRGPTKNSAFLQAEGTGIYYSGEYVAGPDHDLRIMRVDGSVSSIEWGMTPTQAGKWIAAIVTGQYDLEGDPKLYVWHHHGVGSDTRNDAIAETLAYPIGDKPVLGLIVLQAGEADFEWGTHDFNTAASVETLTYEPASGAALVKALYARIRQLESAFILPTSDPLIAGALWNNGGTPTISAGA